jgi:hypothetical protein
MLPILAAILVAIGVVALIIFAWWGLPILAAAAVLAAISILAARKSDTATTIERGRPPEPTGTPRKGSGGAETANDRVGQA